MLSLLMVLRYIWVFSLISSCVLYLHSSYLFWTELEVDRRHWSTLFIMTIHTRCSVQNRVTAKQISSFFSLLMNCDGLIPLFDDQRSLTNIHELLLDLQILLLLFFSYGDATLFSAVVCIILFTQPFCLEKNKKYYIHIWIWCFCFLLRSAYSQSNLKTL